MEMTEQGLSVVLQDNIDLFEIVYKDCDDVIRRDMYLGKEPRVRCYIAFVEVAVNNILLEDSVIGKLLNQMWVSTREEIYDYIKNNSLGISDMKELETMKEVNGALLSGNAVLFIDGYDKAIKISSQGYPNKGVPQADAEKVLRGSNEAFSESVKVNTSLVRKRIRDTKLKVKEQQVGRRSNTTVAIVYEDDLVQPELLQRIKDYLMSFEIDGVLDSGVIEQLTENHWYSPFPQFQTTERPDKAAQAVLEGRIVVLSDNSPIALILPTSMNSFFQTPDDYYNKFEIVSFLRLLRYIGAFIAIGLPGLYLAVTEFHTQLLPTNLILSFAAARSGVPFSALVEVLVMELSFEFLREGGVRLPGVLGNTVGIVGGLIIGQAAVSANLVSPIVVIVVALTALCSFTIPNDEFATAFRLFKFVVIFLSAWLGIFGSVIGFLILAIHLCHLQSFGIPYLMPFVAADVNDYQDRKDSLVRFPIFSMGTRPVFTRKGARQRMGKTKYKD